MVKFCLLQLSEHSKRHYYFSMCIVIEADTLKPIYLIFHRINFFRRIMELSNKEKLIVKILNLILFIFNSTILEIDVPLTI